MSAYPQIQSDLSATNLNIHCDPRTVGTYFLDPQGKRVLDVESKAGKIAVEDDICNLTVNGKLTVVGEIILNGEILDVQGFLTNPLQVNIDANNFNITNVSQISADRVTATGAIGVVTDRLTASSGNPLAIVGTGININDAQPTGDLKLNVSDANNASIELLFNQAAGSSGITPTINTIKIGANAVNSFAGTQPKNQKVVIGTAPNRINDAAVPQGPATTIITIGSVGAASLPANKEQNRLIFFGGEGVTGGAPAPDGTNPDTLAAAGLDKATIDLAAPATAIADITKILQDYGLIQ